MTRIVDNRCICYKSAETTQKHRKTHNQNQYKCSYSGQSNIQSLLIPSPLCCELNFIARTPLAYRDCCPEQKKQNNTRKLTITFFQVSVQIPSRTAEGPETCASLTLWRASRQDTRDHAVISGPKEQRDLSSASEPPLRHYPRKGYLSPFLPRCRAEGRKKCSTTVNNSKDNSFQRRTSFRNSDTRRLHFHVYLFPPPHLCSFSCSHSVLVCRKILE
ncbi:hypothetical protein CDAR_209171 [Caerostris darwini]|uniref:Uncharacterized protein n=1 Tax=Caerostris darwini TaxID=1538125 RepID=A0AAV4VGB8_9ARAC|nr:hypothetical protein CDAR_209171 [Caerostris darwini]